MTLLKEIKGNLKSEQVYNNNHGLIQSRVCAFYNQYTRVHASLTVLVGD